MMGLFDTEPEEKKPESSPVLEYLEKFFRLNNLRYDQLIVHAVGDEKIIGIIEVTGLSKAMSGIVSATMYSDLGYDNWYELVDYFLEKKVCVINRSSIITNLPEVCFDPPKAPTMLMRRM